MLAKVLIGANHVILPDCILYVAIGIDFFTKQKIVVLELLGLVKRIPCRWFAI